MDETKLRDFTEIVDRKVQFRKMLCKEKAEVWETMSVKTMRDGSENNPQVAGSVRLQDPWFCWYYSVMTLIYFIINLFDVFPLYKYYFEVLTWSCFARCSCMGLWGKHRGPWLGCYFHHPVHPFHLFSLGSHCQGHDNIAKPEAKHPVSIPTQSS